MPRLETLSTIAEDEHDYSYQDEEEEYEYEDEDYEDDDHEDDDEREAYDYHTGENISIRYANPIIDMRTSLTEYKALCGDTGWRDDKKVLFKIPFIGTELEVEARNGCTPMGGVLAAHHLNWRDRTNYGRFFWYKPDSSLNYGVEIVSHPASLAYWHENYDKLVIYTTELQKYFKGFHTSSAGGHVHISRDSFTPLHIWKFVMFHNANKELIVRVAQRIENHWWSFERDDSYNELLARSLKKDGDRYTFGRYRAVNMHNEKTIELRYFKSNISATRILKNIEFAHAVWAHTRDMPAWKISNTNEFLVWLYNNRKAYPHLYTFLKEVYKRTLSKIEEQQRTVNHNLKKLVLT